MTDPYQVLGVSAKALRMNRLKVHTENLPESITRTTMSTTRWQTLRRKR